jgi:glyoxylase-like metal-dependent hydrolase (beta-lactamase superfamily II)
MLIRVARIELPEHDLVGIRADNPGPFTLSGTNSWVVGRDPAWLVDPGPAISSHLEAVASEIDDRGGLGGIVLTHDHGDHVDGVPALRRRFAGAPFAAGRGASEIRLADGETCGPFEALAIPGHAPDHFALMAGDVAFTGDAVLGEGSVFIAPDPGALAGYLDGLERLRRRNPAVLCPGHGDPVYDAQAKLSEYISHRLERERRLLGALETGKRSVDDLLDDAWSDVPAQLRGAAAVTLAAHLDKLGDEGRLPSDVERPRLGA